MDLDNLQKGKTVFKLKVTKLRTIDEVHGILWFIKDPNSFAIGWMRATVWNVGTYVGTMTTIKNQYDLAKLEHFTNSGLAWDSRAPVVSAGTQQHDGLCHHQLKLHNWPQWPAIGSWILKTTRKSDRVNPTSKNTKLTMWGRDKFTNSAG